MHRSTDLNATAATGGGTPFLTVRTWPGLLLAGVTVHPLARGDSDTVQHVFDGLSARSRLLRFLGPTPRLSPEMAHRLADVDHDAHGAWVARVFGEPVGIGRYIRLDDPAVAEIALEVVDRDQGLGLGRLLLDVVGAAAADAGTTSLLWLMDEGNRPVRRLAAPLGGRFTHDDHGLVEATTGLPLVPLAEAAEVACCAAAARRAAAGRAAA
jgi:GNAT superfamily N-acetyltransferase